MTGHEVRHGRAIVGMSAVLLPFTDTDEIDWAGFETHLERTIDAGLAPAVNMDTGFGPVLEPAERSRALQITAALAPPGWVAGAQVADAPGAGFDGDAYARECAAIANAGGMPILFPSFGLQGLDDDALVAAHALLAAGVDRMLGFELGSMFHPAGRIFSLDGFRAVLEIPGPQDPTGPIVPDAPSQPAVPIDDPAHPAVPDTPDGPSAPEPDDPMPATPDGPSVPAPDGGSRALHP